MNYKFLSLILLFLGLIKPILSQEITEERRAMYAKAMFGIANYTMAAEERKFEIAAYRPADFFSETASKEVIENCLALIQKTGYLSFVYEDWSKDIELVFNAKLPEFYDGQMLDRLDISVNEANLSNAKNKIKVFNQIVDNSGYSEIKYKIKIKDDNVDTVNVKGTVSFHVDFLTKYDQISLSKEEIGKEFLLNEINYKLVAVQDNKAIVEKQSEGEANLSIINFIKGNQVVQSESYTQTLDMRLKMDPDYFLRQNQTSSRSGINSKIYELFSNHSDMTPKKFDELITIDFMKSMKGSNQYMVVKNLAPIGERFILYAPVYDRRTITIQK